MASTNAKTRRDMKRIMCAAAVLILSAVGLSAQSPTTTYPYLYDTFTSGTVVMSDGNKEARQMNVHLRAGKLHYLDDGVIKEAFLQDVAAVEIGDDVYLPVGFSVMKVVAKNDNGCVVLEQLGFAGRGEDDLLVFHDILLIHGSHNFTMFFLPCLH